MRTVGSFSIDMVSKLWCPCKLLTFKLKREFMRTRSLVIENERYTNETDQNYRRWAFEAMETYIQTIKRTHRYDYCTDG